MTTEEFIKKARKVHGNKYNYSKTFYKKSKEKVEIICPIHGSFFQTPDNHLQNRQCPSCGKEARAKKKSLTKEEFSVKVKYCFGDKYDCSFVEYKNNHTKVKLICKEHGEFWQSPMHLLEGKSGCLQCSKEKFKKSRAFSKEEFIKRAKEKFPEYDYSITEYKSSQEEIQYICPKHGIQKTIGNSLLQGFGCPKCGKEKSIENKKKNKEKEFKEKFKYLNLSKFKYENNKVQSIIICPEHGEFKLSPSQLKRGRICPKCRKQYGYTGHNSNGETKILNFLKERNISFEREIGFPECKDKNPLPFDFYIPEKNLLIEYNGVQHYYYSPMFHKTIRGFHLQRHHDWLKRKFTKNNNIQLLTINYKDDIIKKLEEIL